MALTSAQVTICQHVLIERDNVPTLVRVVDMFMAPPATAPVPGGASPVMAMTLYITTRFTRDDDGLHSVGFTLTRPDGSVKKTEIATQRPNRGALQDADSSINIVAQVGVEPTHFGKHYFTVLVDEKEVAMATFFIVQLPAEAAPPGPN